MTVPPRPHPRFLFALLCGVLWLGLFTAVPGARADGIEADDLPPPDPPVALLQTRQILREWAPRIDPADREAIAHLIYRAVSERGMRPFTVLGLIQQESRFDPEARGPRGSLGLMQIRPFVAKDVARRHRIPWQGKKTLLDPVTNVRIGLIYLHEQLARFGSMEKALAAYNIGPSRLKRRLAAGHTKRGPYVTQVLRKAAILAAVTAAHPAEPTPSLTETAGG